MGKKKRKYDKGASVGFLMALPTVLGLILLNIYPLCRTVYMSFFKSGAFGKWTFVGLDNYVTMFQSAGFWTVTKNTLLFMLLTVPVTVILGLLIAVLLNQSINGKTVFRAIYFLPMVVAPAAVAMVWKWLFNAEYGIINIVLGALHLPSKIQWISDPKTALLACAIVTIWSSVGYDAILLLSGLQSIDASYYEAAAVDGASYWQKMFQITIPLVRPNLTISTILNIIYVFNSFPIIWTITKGDPANRTDTLVTYLYKLAFYNGKQGQAAAVSVIGFLILLFCASLYMVSVLKKGDE